MGDTHNKRPLEEDDHGGQLVAVAKRARTDDAGALAVGAARPALKEGPKRTSGLLAPTMLLTGHDDAVLALAFSPDGATLASGSHDRTIFLWRTYGECENAAVLRGHRNAVLDVRWTPDGEGLVSCSPDRSVRAWDAATGAQLARLGGHAGVVNAAALPPRGPPLVASGGDDRAVHVWDLREAGAEGGGRPARTFSERYQVCALSWAADGGAVFAGGIENVVHAWDLRREAEPAWALPGHADTVTGLATSPDGARLASNAADNTLRVWDVRPYAPGSRLERVLTGHAHGFERNLLRVAWSADGGRLAAGSSDRLVNVWSAKTGALEYRLPGHKGCVNAVAFHPSEPILASGASDKAIYLGELAE